MKMARICRKCKDPIPIRIKIDGKWKNLQNRKFCLKCSPFKSHNTSPYDPVKRQAGETWKESSEERKKQITLSLYKRALTRKHELIEQLGGGCDECGYNFSWRALSFHHKNPAEKNFGLSLNMLWSQSMETIQKEVDKCQLLCLNCHAELGQDTHYDIVAEVNKKYGTNF